MDVEVSGQQTRQNTPSREAQRQAKREAKNAKPVGHISFYEAGRREKLARAKLAEYREQREKGELVQWAVIQRLAFERDRQVRDALLNIADRIAGLVAAESEQAKCHAIILKECLQCLEGLAT